MTRTLFLNARIATPTGLAAPTSLLISEGRIQHIGAAPASAAASGWDERIDVEGGYLLPGFIDTQVNGGGGALFNDAPTPETIATIGEAHARFGTTGFLPTLISDDLDKIDAAMRAVEAAIETGAPGVLGIHIEGPFINVSRKGIHDASKFRRLDASSIGLLSSLRKGRTLVTLAPELCTPEDIRTLVRAGVIVAAGHTEADHATTRRALDAGVSGFTHLFNAMSPMSHRAPGAVGAALDDMLAYCGIIADGRHVDPVALRVALRARPVERFMLVTDAMPTVGSDTGSFVLNGQTIRVRDGVCRGADGTLAGSDLNMAQAVKNTVAMCDLPIWKAALMAATAPARFLGLETQRGSLMARARADIVWMDADLEVRGIWRGGEPVAPATGRSGLGPACGTGRHAAPDHAPAAAL